MEFEFTGEILEWRGPAPYYYVAMPQQDSDDLKEAAAALTYGWGVIPVTVRIGETEWTTSLFPKDGRYLVPLKDKVRKAEDLAAGQTVDVSLTAGAP